MIIPLQGLMALYQSADFEPPKADAPGGGGQVEGLQARVAVAADLETGTIYVADGTKIVPADKAIGEAWTFVRLETYAIDPFVKVSDFPPTFRAESLS